MDGGVMMSIMTDGDIAPELLTKVIQMEVQGQFKFKC